MGEVILGGGPAWKGLITGTPATYTAAEHFVTAFGQPALAKCIISHR